MIKQIQERIKDIWIKQELIDIAKQYTPENDIIPNAPRVTITEWRLLNLIRIQQERTEKLEEVVRRLLDD